jgi:hypothetical protein
MTAAASASVLGFNAFREGMRREPSDEKEEEEEGEEDSAYRPPEDGTAGVAPAAGVSSSADLLDEVLDEGERDALRDKLAVLEDEAERDHLAIIAQAQEIGKTDTEISEILSSTATTRK